MAVKFIKQESARSQVIEDHDRLINKVAVPMLETFIKNRTPVRTGNLKASMTGRKTGFAQGEVATSVPYAEFVEFGIGSQTDSPKGSRHPKWKGFSPRAMMRKGAQDLVNLGVSIFK